MQQLPEAKGLRRQNNDFYSLEGIHVQRSVCQGVTGGSGSPPGVKIGTVLLLEFLHKCGEGKHPVGAVQWPGHMSGQN